MKGDPKSQNEEAHRDKVRGAIRSAAGGRAKTKKASAPQIMQYVPLATPIVIAVASGKGGVGKTLIATALAEAAANFGRRVLILDLDFFNRGLTGLFSREECRGKEVKIPAFLSAFADAGQWLLTTPEPLLGETLWTVVFPALPIQAIEAAASVPGQQLCDDLKDLITHAAGLCRADLVVLDCHGGPDRLSFAACAIAHHALLVSEPDEVALHGLLNFIRLYESQTEVRPNHFRLIYNKVPRGLTVSSLKAAYVAEIESAQTDDPSPDRKSLSAWFSGRELLVAVPNDETLIIPREGAFVPTLLYPWSPLAQRARTILASLAATQPPAVAKAAGRRGLWPSVVSGIWSAIESFRRSFLGLNPLILEVAFWMRVAVAVLFIYAGAASVQKALIPDRYKMHLASFRLVAIRLFDHYQWDQKPWFSTGDRKDDWNEVRAFAKGGHTEEVEQNIAGEVENKVKHERLSMRAARLEAEVLALGNGIGFLTQDNSDEGVINYPQAIANLSETLGVKDPLAWLGRPGEPYNRDRSFTFDYKEGGAFADFHLYYRTRQHARQWKPSSPEYMQAWNDATAAIESVSITRLRLLDAADFICSLHNALIEAFAAGILCLGVLAVHRLSQRKAATAFVRRRYFSAATWLAISPFMCIPLAGQLRPLWEQMELWRENTSRSYYLPTGDAAKAWLLFGTILLVLMHNAYRVVIAALEAHPRREVAFRAALLCLAVGVVWAAWGFGLKIIPQVVGSPP